MRLKITSDGTAQGTHLTDVSGRKPKPIGGMNVYRMNLRADWSKGGPLACELFCLMPSLDAIADADLIHVSESVLTCAKLISRRFNNPEVTRAINELLGIKL